MLLCARVQSLCLLLGGDRLLAAHAGVQSISGTCTVRHCEGAERDRGAQSLSWGGAAVAVSLCETAHSNSMRQLYLRRCSDPQTAALALSAGSYRADRRLSSCLRASANSPIMRLCSPFPAIHSLLPLSRGLSLRVSHSGHSSSAKLQTHRQTAGAQDQPWRGPGAPCMHASVVAAYHHLHVRASALLLLHPAGALSCRGRSPGGVQRGGRGATRAAVQGGCVQPQARLSRLCALQAYAQVRAPAAATTQPSLLLVSRPSCPLAGAVHTPEAARCRQAECLPSCSSFQA